MRSDKEVFESAVNEYKQYLSPRLPDEAIPRTNELLPLFKSTADRWIQKFRTGSVALRPLPAVIVDYLDSTQIGAWAFRHKKGPDDVYVIATNYGSIFMLSFVFNYLLSDRRVLPTIGDVANERESLPAVRLTHDYADTTRQIGSLGLSLHDFVPRDPVRKEVAGWLMQVSIYFILGHEFRHIQGGHVDYLNTLHPVSPLSEYTSHSLNPDYAMKRQAMEADADSFSLTAMLRTFWFDRETRFANVKASRHLFSDDSTLLLLCLIACSAYFRIVDNGKSLPNEWRRGSHPPHRVRRVMLLLTAISFFQRRGLKETADAIMPSSLEKYFDTIETAFGDFGCEPSAKTYHALVQNGCYKHLEEIDRATKSIISGLSLYSYVAVSLGAD